MKQKSKLLGIIIVLSTFLIASMAWSGGEEEEAIPEVAPARVKARIGYITPVGHEYWAVVKRAAEDWAKELDVDLTMFQGPVVEQISAIEDMISKGMDAMVVTAQDSEAIVPAIRKLNEAGIPVIGADILPSRGDCIAKVQVDPAEGGRMIGEFLLEKLGKNKKLFVLETETYIEVIDIRLKAAYKMLEENGWEVIIQPCSPYGRDSAKEITETILLANPDMAAIYTLNDDTAMGSQLAVEAQGKENIIVAGYDAEIYAVESVEQERMDVTIFQDNKLIARWSIEQCLAYLETPWTGTVVYKIPPVLVTKDNVADFKAKYMAK